MMKTPQEPKGTQAPLKMASATRSAKGKFVGRWHLHAMSEWDYEYLSMLGPPELQISSDGSGSIRFGALEGVLDVMADEWRPDEILQFTIIASDEGDDVHGRGCAMIRDDLLIGRIAFHQGEVSDFEAGKLPKGG